MAGSLSTGNHCQVTPAFLRGFSEKDENRCFSFSWVPGFLGSLEGPLLCASAPLR
jgi:hypothetical protein